MYIKEIISRCCRKKPKMASVFVYLNFIVNNVNLLFLILIFLGSSIMTFFVAKYLLRERAKLRKLRNERRDTINRIAIKNEQISYTRDRIVFAILISEVIVRVVAMINIIYLNFRYGHNNNNYTDSVSLSDNCTLVPGTSLYRLYARDYGYSILISLFLALGVFTLSLLCYLNLFLIKIYRNDHKRRDIYGYLISCVIKVLLIILLQQFPATFLIAEIVYIGSFTLDYLLLILLTRKLYKLIQGRYLELLYHGSEEDLKYKDRAKRNIAIYKLFSTMLLTSYGLQVLGQNLQTIIQTLIGSVLENPCWFYQMYGIEYKITFQKQPYEMSAIVSVYLEFTLGSLFNLGLLLSYIGYVWVVLRGRKRRVYRYHLERVSESESLLQEHYTTTQ